MSEGWIGIYSAAAFAPGPTAALSHKILGDLIISAALRNAQADPDANPDVNP
jgi:hypothetical protein